MSESKATIRVVMALSGVVFKYEITASDEQSLQAKAREHCAMIVATGYRNQRGDTYTHWPPHLLAKVQAIGVKVPTDYPDEIEGT